MPPRRVGAGRRADIERHAGVVRLAELEAERARLLREVQKKRRLIAAAQAEASRLSGEALARMRPIVERQRALAAALEALFAELLLEGRLAARARKEVRSLRAFLEQLGVLEPRFEGDDVQTAELEEEASSAGPAPWEAPPRHARRSVSGSGSTATGPQVAGAAQAGQERRSLRDIFRKLAKLVHPDQAQQEEERQRRTELMKQVTRAYEDGDLAKLLELEGDWQSESALNDAEPEARRRQLERVNRELLSQLRAVTAELRESKRALRDASDACPDLAAIELATRELDQIQAILELLRRVRDGRGTWEDLSHGPWSSSSRAERRKRR